MTCIFTSYRPLTYTRQCIHNHTATMVVDDKPLRSDSPVQVVMVNVTAPASLPAGYEFEAQVNNDPEMTVHAVVVGEFILNLVAVTRMQSSHLLFISIA